MKFECTTVGYLQKGEDILMLYRNAKENDINEGKWIGVGGHIENGESPDECFIRETYEETGFKINTCKYRGIITFVYEDKLTEFVSVFTSDDFCGEQKQCDEGKLKWIRKNDIYNLNVWEGDKIFFKLIEDNEEFFSLKLEYTKEDKLKSAKLNGKNMELFDIVDENGNKTGVVQERGVVHRTGMMHRSVHMWIVNKDENGKTKILLQKRSKNKDSHPGCYDISSAGHISAGDEVINSAIREIKEELGIDAKEEDFKYIGNHRGYFKDYFYGKLFFDNSISPVYIYCQKVDIEKLTLQKEEIESVKWFDFDECYELVKTNKIKHCIYLDELDMLKEYIL